MYILIFHRRFTSGIHFLSLSQEYVCQTGDMMKPVAAITQQIVPGGDGIQATTMPW